MELSSADIRAVEPKFSVSLTQNIADKMRDRSSKPQNLAEIKTQYQKRMVTPLHTSKRVKILKRTSHSRANSYTRAEGREDHNTYNKLMSKAQEISKILEYHPTDSRNKPVAKVVKSRSQVDVLRDILSDSMYGETKSPHLRLGNYQRSCSQEMNLVQDIIDNNYEENLVLESKESSFERWKKDFKVKKELMARKVSMAREKGMTPKQLDNSVQFKYCQRKNLLLRVQGSFEKPSTQEMLSIMDKDPKKETQNPGFSRKSSLVFSSRDQEIKIQDQYTSEEPKHTPRVRDFSQMSLPVELGLENIGKEDLPHELNHVSPTSIYGQEEKANTFLTQQKPYKGFHQVSPECSFPSRANLDDDTRDKSKCMPNSTQSLGFLQSVILGSDGYESVPGSLGSIQCREILMREAENKKINLSFDINLNPKKMKKFLVGSENLDEKITEKANDESAANSLRPDTSKTHGRSRSDLAKKFYLPIEIGKIGPQVKGPLSSETDRPSMSKILKKKIVNTIELKKSPKEEFRAKLLSNKKISKAKTPSYGSLSDLTCFPESVINLPDSKRESKVKQIQISPSKVWALKESQNLSRKVLHGKKVLISRAETTKNMSRTASMSKDLKNCSEMKNLDTKQAKENMILSCLQLTPRDKIIQVKPDSFLKNLNEHKVRAVNIKPKSRYKSLLENQFAHH